MSKRKLDHEAIADFFKAIEENNIYLVQKMLEQMPDLIKNSWDGNSPLKRAILTKNRSLEMIKMLVTKGADLQELDLYGNSMLHLAASVGNIDIVGFFISCRLEINKYNKKGTTPTDLAIKGSAQLDTIQLLTENGGVITLNPNQGTALHIVVSQWRKDLIKDLLNRGEAVNALDNQGRTPLHIAASEGLLDLIKLLLDHGAKVNARDNEGCTPLHIAASKETINLAIELLKRGAEVNARDNEGCTPLHIAASTGKLDLIKDLLKRGAEVNAQDKKGFTPIASAYKNKHLGTFLFFAENGALLTLTFDGKNTKEMNEALTVAIEVDKLFIRDLKGNPTLLLDYHNKSCIEKRIALLTEDCMKKASHLNVANMVNILRKINATQPDNNQLTFPTFDTVTAEVDQYIIIEALKSLYVLEKRGTNLWNSLPKDNKWEIMQEFMHGFNPKVVEDIIKKKVAHEERLELIKGLKNTIGLLTKFDELTCEEQNQLLKDYKERLEAQKKSLEEAAIQSQEAKIIVQSVKPEEEASEIFFDEEGNGPIASGMLWEPGPFPW